MEREVTIPYPAPALLTPFIRWKKEQIVAVGKQLGAPLHLTYSCYMGREKHCGKCATCIERRRAFEMAGVKDETEYEP
jgi:7-cyano-7-deazaguanine synthase